MADILDWGKKILGKAGQVLGIAGAAIRQFSPVVEDEVTVEVLGQPGASKQQLYFLAMAAANGVVHRFGPIASWPAPAASMLMIEYDAADHWVRCTLRFVASTLMAATPGIASGVPGFTQEEFFFRTAPVYNGPPCEVVGKPNDFTDDVGLPGIPNAKGRFNPILPFANRTILTTCPAVSVSKIAPIGGLPAIIAGAVIPTPNPSPPGDGRSRGVMFKAAPGAVGPRGPLPAPRPPGTISAVVSTAVGSDIGPGGVPIGPGVGPGISSDGSPADGCCDKIAQLVPLVFAAK